MQGEQQYQEGSQPVFKSTLHAAAMTQSGDGEDVGSRPPITLTSGSDHSLCVCAGGELYSWGGDTMGQLGQGRTVCMEAGTSGEAHIDCGTGATIGLVEAYYGNPTGSCTCPVERRPVPDCPAVEDDGVCSPLDGFCFLGPRRSVCVCRCLGSCFEGSAYMFVSVFVCAEELI